VPGACVAGFWKDSKVAFLDLQTLEPIATEKVAEDGDTLAVPRSLIVARILADQPATLFVGLADGNVVTYSIESSQRLFTARKSIILGTQQANFALLPRGNEGLENVFATCEHPSLIYGSDGRIVYSAVTAENAASICSFDSNLYPGAIAIATEEGELKLAMVDEERTTHVQTLPVHETVRRVAYSPELKAFGLGTIKRTLEAGEERVESHFKLVDEVAFQELHTFPLNEDELIECCIRCRLDDGSGDEEGAERFVVGTAYLDDADGGQGNPRGRILIFEVTEERKLKLTLEHALRGACRCLGMVDGRIVAALIKTVSLNHICK
jgi:DNA damage-binding protein 1